jgi:hypothetical protein
LVPAYDSPVGASALTSSITVVCAMPPLFDATTLYITCGSDTLVGVPVILPVDLSNRNPAGSAGLTLYDTIAPPLADGAGNPPLYALSTVKLKCDEG